MPRSRRTSRRTAAWLAAKSDKRFNAATSKVSLQDLSRVGDTAVFMDEPAIDLVEQQMMERRHLDSREMSNMFDLLRSNGLICADAVNNYLTGEAPPPSTCCTGTATARACAAPRTAGTCGTLTKGTT